MKRMRAIIQNVINGSTFITKTEVNKDNKQMVKVEIIDRKNGGPYERILQKFNNKILQTVQDSFTTYYQLVDNTFADIEADVSRSMALQSSEDGPGHAEACKQLQQKLLPLKKKLDKLEKKMAQLEKGVELIQNFEQNLFEDSSEDEDKDGGSLFVSDQTQGKKRPVLVLE
jgi:chromosome condensin MukBEF ATPase and DNA-binding subunit MukB